MTFEELLEAKKQNRTVRVRDGLGWCCGRLNALALKYSWVAHGSNEPGTLCILKEYPNEEIELAPTMKEILDRR